MADKTGEQLSALVDGECEAQELQLALRRLAKDKDIKARWQRYHLLSDAIKNNIPELIDADFADRIRKAIDNETPLHTSRFPSVSSFYKPVVGFAVAASVAAVAVFAVKFTVLNDPRTPPLVAATDPGIEQSQIETEITTFDTELESRLNSYLVNHNEYVSRNSVHGMLPYVRMVGYEPSKR